MGNLNGCRDLGGEFYFSQNDLITVESEGHHQKLKPFVNRGMT